MINDNNNDKRQQQWQKRQLISDDEVFHRMDPRNSRFPLLSFFPSLHWRIHDELWQRSCNLLFPRTCIFANGKRAEFVIDVLDEDNNNNNNNNKNNNNSDNYNDNDNDNNNNNNNNNRLTWVGGPLGMLVK